MKISRLVSGVVAILSLLFIGLPGLALASVPVLAVPSGLSIAQIKITGSEFIMLENNTGMTIGDLSIYRLYSSNNSNPLAPGASSTTQQLPVASLPAGQTVLLSANGGATCGAAVTDSLSISFTDSQGYIALVQQSLVSGQLVQTTGDITAWGSGTTPSAGMIGSVPSGSSAPLGAYYRYQNPAPTPPFLWQRADIASATNVCQLNITGTATPAPINTTSQLLPSLPPPARIITLAASSTNFTGMAASDIGLRAPQITELLPNPASPQTDADNEFVELYNSNPVSFDLVNFVLQTGTTTPHKYIFPQGTILKPQAFTAFLLKGTGLSLSNSGGLVQLLDPSGKSISKTDTYSTAKDGLAWALAEGKWYWTSTPSPSAENIINEPGTATGRSSTSGSPQVLGATAAGSTSSSNLPNGNSTTAASLHPSALAGVGALAVGYALYEYRQDLANGFHKLRRYREARAAARAKLARRRGTGAEVRPWWRQNDLHERVSSWLKDFFDRF